MIDQVIAVDPTAGFGRTRGGARYDATPLSIVGITSVVGVTGNAARVIGRQAEMIG